MKPQIPWLRVFVEGVVIVGSILLAFGLQAWWEGRQERAMEAEYLTRLVGDLHADTAELALAVRRWSAYEQSAQVVLSVLRGDQQLLGDPGAVLAQVVVATHDRSPYMESATYEELRSSGGLHLIRDLAMRDAVVGYHRALDSGESYISRMDRDYHRYVTSRVPPEFASLADQLCQRPDGSLKPCSPSVAGLDARGVLDSMIRDPTFMRLVNLRVGELVMARGLLERRLNAGVEALQTLEGAVQHR